jgi:hypothetical protein
MMTMRRRSATGRGGAQGENHRTVRLLAAKLYLCSVAVSMKHLAFVRSDDDGLRRATSIRDYNGIGWNLHDGGSD